MFLKYFLKNFKKICIVSLQILLLNQVVGTTESGRWYYLLLLNQVAGTTFYYWIRSLGDCFSSGYPTLFHFYYWIRSLVLHFTTESGRWCYTLLLNQVAGNPIYYWIRSLGIARWGLNPSAALLFKISWNPWYEFQKSFWRYINWLMIRVRDSDFSFSGQGLTIPGPRDWLSPIWNYWSIEIRLQIAYVF